MSTSSYIDIIRVRKTNLFTDTTRETFLKGNEGKSGQRHDNTVTNVTYIFVRKENANAGEVNLPNMTANKKGLDTKQML